MSEPILATNQFRAAVATAAAGGGVVPAAAQIGFGTGTTPADVADTGMESEFIRKPLESAAADGVVLTVKGTLTGAEAGDHAVTEVAVFAGDGTLMGRRVFKPKELEPESALDFYLDFQF